MILSFARKLESFYKELMTPTVEILVLSSSLQSCIGGLIA
jgi:hypothetical protein